MIKRIIYTLYEEVEADTDEEAFDKSIFDESNLDELVFLDREIEDVERE